MSAGFRFVGFLAGVVVCSVAIVVVIAAVLEAIVDLP